MHYTVFLSTFLLSLLFIPLNIRMAKKFSLVDRPNSRSMHTKTIPSSGGIGFFAAALISLFVFEREHLFEYYYVYVGVMIVWIAGIMDDIYNIRPRVKFLFIFVSSFLIYLHHLAIYQLGTYVGHSVVLPALLVFLFTLFAIAGYTNAINLTDGIDGLSTSMSIVIMFPFMMIGILHQDMLLIFLSGVFISALFGFLFFNWHPARIFMGDSGSLVLGFVISVLAIESLHYIEPITALYFLALPFLDTMTVMVRRKLRGKSVFLADKTHMHHVLIEKKMRVAYVVFVLVGVQIMYLLLGYLSLYVDSIFSLLMFVLFFLLHFTFFKQDMLKKK